MKALLLLYAIFAVFFIDYLWYLRWPSDATWCQSVNVSIP